MNYRTKVARKQGARSKHAKKQQLKRKNPVRKPYSVKRKPYTVKRKQATIRRLSQPAPTVSPNILTNYSRLEDEYSKPIKLTQKKPRKYHKSFLILLLHILATHNRMNPELNPPKVLQSAPNRKKTTGPSYSVSLKPRPGDFCSGREDCGYYPRTEMPQVDNSKDEQKFKQSLKSNDYKIKLVKEFDFKQFPKPTQREISLAKVGNICGYKSLTGENPIILLKVRFEIAGKIETKYAIIDGHHRSVALSTPDCGIGNKAPALVVRSPRIIRVPDGISNPIPTINSGLDLEFTRLRDVIPKSLMKGYAF